MKLTAERLREVLSYDPETGVFTWFAARGSGKVGSVAGCLAKDGYRVIRIDRQRYLASRLVWLYTTGSWPKFEIDHKNGIRDDDRWVNLRDVTRSENQQNLRRALSNSTTGFLGVSRHQGNFQAQIRLDGKSRYLGTFSTPEEAHAAYLNAKRGLHQTCTI